MSKAERIDRIRNELYSEDELLRKLPEIDAIHDEELREKTINLFMRGCPDYFWERPSSSTGKYHSPDERGLYGNWLHVKRVFATYCDISESWVELGIITPYQKQEGKVAALYHDVMKYGWPSDQNEHTVNDHDLIAADMARHVGGFNEPICAMLEQHMGPWGEGPIPDTKNALLLHTADKIASREKNDIGVYFPAEELLEEWPDIKVIDYEEGEEI